MKIGNIYDGICPDVVTKYINNYLNIIFKHCAVCWAYRLCRACFRDIDFENKEATDKEFPDYCINYKNRLSKIITVYTEIIAANPSSFSVYEKPKSKMKTTSM